MPSPIYKLTLIEGRGRVSRIFRKHHELSEFLETVPDTMEREENSEIIIHISTVKEDEL